MAKKAKTTRTTIVENSSEHSERTSEPIQASKPTQSPSCVWIGDYTPELAWVASKLTREIDLLRLETDNHFQRFGPQLSPTHVVMAVHDRRPSLPIDFQAVRSMWPNAKPIIVLGEWWTGHRRCHPLPDDIPSYYWYQWWEDLHREFDNERTIDSGSQQLSIRLQRIVSRTTKPPQVSERLRMALVTVDDAPIREMWMDILPTLGWQPVARTSDESIPRTSFEMAILDVGFKELRSEENVEQSSRLIREISSRATSNIIVRDGFPCYSRWCDWEAAGAKWCIQNAVLPNLAI